MVLGNISDTKAGGDRAREDNTDSKEDGLDWAIPIALRKGVRS